MKGSGLLLLMPLMLNSKFLYSSQYSVDSSSNTSDALGLPSLRIDLGNHYKPEIKSPGCHHSHSGVAEHCARATLRPPLPESLP